MFQQLHLIIVSKYIYDIFCLTEMFQQLMFQQPIVTNDRSSIYVSIMIIDLENVTDSIDLVKHF